MIDSNWIIYLCGGLIVLFSVGLGIFLIIFNLVSGRKSQQRRKPAGLVIGSLLIAMPLCLVCLIAFIIFFFFRR